MPSTKKRVVKTVKTFSHVIHIRMWYRTCSSGIWFTQKLIFLELEKTWIGERGEIGFSSDDCFVGVSVWICWWVFSQWSWFCFRVGEIVTRHITVSGKSWDCHRVVFSPQVRSSWLDGSDPHIFRARILFSSSASIEHNWERGQRNIGKYSPEIDYNSSAWIAYIYIFSYPFSYTQNNLLGEEIPAINIAKWKSILYALCLIPRCGEIGQRLFVVNILLISEELIWIVCILWGRSRGGNDWAPMTTCSGWEETIVLLCIPQRYGSWKCGV